MLRRKGEKKNPAKTKDGMQVMKKIFKFQIEK